MRSAILLLLIWTLVQSGCGWSDEEAPSVLLLAVDSLPVDEVNCEASFKGLHSFCKESVRFTHAYTTSVLQQPALGSLLTARYPSEINLWHNGDQYLSSRYQTVAEKALNKGIRTSFFSGGVPVWSKSGINQGFEVFNDQIPVGIGNYYRDASTNFELFASWLKNMGRQRFFSVIYIPDLQFPSKETISGLGKIREKSYKGQLEELDESLSWLWSQLKKMNRWHNTVVVLVGLNGRLKNSKWNEIKSFNLFSENTQVALLIKPQSKKRDTGLQWKEDRNVSLIDVGNFLFDSLDLALPKRTDFFLKTSSLKNDVFNKKGKSIEKHIEKKIILTESGWSQWRGLGESRFTLRQGPFLYFHESSPKLYNSFVDHFEVSPVSSNDRIYVDFLKKMQPFLQTKGFLFWDSENSEALEKYHIASQVFGKGYFSDEDYRDIRALNLKNPKDKQIASWLVLFLLKKKKWLELKKLGKKFKDTVWEAVAEFHLHEESSFPREGCLDLLGKKKKERMLFRHCNDLVIIKFSQWIQEKKGSSVRKRKKEAFLGSYFRNKMDTQIGHLNIQAGFSWDIDMTKNYGASDIDVILSLPEYRWVTEIIEKRAQKSFF